jgi:hypothetical protein
VTKNRHLQLYKITRVCSGNWRWVWEITFLYLVFAGSTWRCSCPKTYIFHWWRLIPSGYISAQNNRYWSSINPRQTFELPLHDQKMCHYCYMNSRAHIFLKTLLIQGSMSVIFFGPFLRALRKKKR